MHGDAETVRAGDLSDAVDALEEHRPRAVRNLRRSGVAGLGQRRGKDDELGSARREPLRLMLDRGELVRTARALVQHRGDETADEPKPARVEQRACLRGIGREESGRSRLGRAKAEGTHVREDTVRSELQAPIGHLTDAPRDRRARESTKRIVDHVEKTKGRVQIGFQRRFDSGFQEARRRVGAGELGTVYSFHMTSRDALPPPDAYAETSGGQFVDQLIHDFDVTRWMFGDEVDDIYATGSTLGFPQYAKWGDVATSGAVLKLRGGAVGLLQAARHNEAGYDIRVEVYGAKDTIAVGLDPRTPMTSVERDGPKMKNPAYPTFFVRFDAAYRAELAHFLRFARGEAENACTVSDGMEALRIALAARRSLQEHRPVAVKEIA